MKDQRINVWLTAYVNAPNGDTAREYADKTLMDFDRKFEGEGYRPRYERIDHIIMGAWFILGWVAARIGPLIFELII